MGMFDWVVLPVEIPCPECGEMLEGWQSKDADCLLEQIGPERVASFYTDCDKCQRWVEFRRRPEPVELVPGFEMVEPEGD